MATTAKAVLRENFLLRGLAEDTLDRIAALAVLTSYPRGVSVFRQGDAGDALYAVISGQLRISAQNADGREVFLSLMEPGDSFGEIAVIDGRPRTASAVTVTASSLFLIRRADLMDLMTHDPVLPMHLLTVFCQRLRWTSDLIEEAAFLDLRARLARRLLRLAEDHGTAGPEGRVLRISQGELGNFLSASRQVTNQHLQEWRSRGWIKLSRGVVVICDGSALDRVAQGENKN